MSARSSRPWAALVVLALTSAPAHAVADDSGRAPLVTSRNRTAELAFHAAIEALDGGDEVAAEERLRAFLFRFPNDALVPRARLELGRLLLSRYDGSDAAVLTDAEDALRRAMDAGDVPVSERARLYAAVVAFHRGNDQAVIATLTSLRGRLVLEEDARLLLSTLAAACERVGNRLCTIEALDRRVAREDDEAAREPLDRELGAAILHLTPDEASALYTSLPADGPAWSRVAIVVLRSAYAGGQLARAAEVARALRAAHITIEDSDLRALALHVERATEVAPYVIGAILPLSGPLAARGQSMLRGLSLGAGIPPQGPFTPSAIQIAIRDHAGRPEAAVRALDELFTLHRVTAVVAPPDEASARAVVERANALGLPVIVLDARITESNAISLGVAYAEEVAALIAEARASGARRIAIVRSADDRRAYLDDAVADEVAVARLDGEPQAMRTVLDEMLTHDPDALLVGIEARDAARFVSILEAALRARRARARVRPRLLFVSTSYAESLLPHAARSLEGGLVAQTRARGTQGFRTRYAARFGEAPDPIARLAFEASTALASALADGSTDRRLIGERLRTLLGEAQAGSRDVTLRRILHGRLIEASTPTP